MSDDLHITSAVAQKSLQRSIFILLILYGVAVLMGWPQKATQMVVDAHQHSAEKHDDDADHNSGEHHAEHEKDPAAHHDEQEKDSEATGDANKDHAKPLRPALWTVIPFILLLGAIAVFPLIGKLEHWWESNLHRLYVAAGLGVLTLGYFAFLHDIPIDAHWPAHNVVEAQDGPVQFEFVWTVFANAILGEFIPFIVLLFSLYTISGGIRIVGDLEATPKTNAIFIGIGALLASFIGTTGAAMLLIRPLLETNRERKHVQHTVVFFIFAVCNCGGCLLPIGDPPLFLGYLRGVSFFWTFVLWQEWLFVNVMIILVYFLWDTYISHPKETKRDVKRDETEIQPLKITGAWVNVPLLLGVIFAVAMLDPSKVFPGTDGWHPFYYLREIVQMGLVGLSLFLGSETIRKDNKFNYHAILEVAALFVGIFICMQPALQILHVEGSNFKDLINSPMAFFWATGSLSAVLDNAPTYVVFFETAKTMMVPEGSTTVILAGGGKIAEEFLVGISLGAVFMGAMTYIGNGPNFMVRAIAEKSGVKMPSFFGYVIFYSIPVLIPIFLIDILLFD